MPNIAIGIPARFASTRFPGKPLAMLCGQPMIAHVVRGAILADIGSVIVATDDQRIADAASAAGAGVFISATHHNSGSERLAEAFAGTDVDIVVNVQGDEPLIEAAAIRAVVRPFAKNAALSMATLAHPLQREDDLYDANVVKVVCNAKGNAMYFSRSAIPFPRQAGAVTLQHVGLYAYRHAFLMQYHGLTDCPAGRSEQLEQLKVLHHGYTIAVTTGAFHSIGVDTAEDLARAEAVLKRRDGKHSATP
ncbi:MAG: 3-deoxy-manno-octulosonate cytidylyltransferase [Mariprofundaceae bacterium]|nr:3-deoxy-manno-octulosonate cytidylyltransferase [Mariprofundaceae bacterium]